MVREPRGAAGRAGAGDGRSLPGARAHRHRGRTARAVEDDDVDLAGLRRLPAADDAGNSRGDHRARVGGARVTTEIPITLTCGDYARVMPLATGEVKPEGIALTMLLGSRGSWLARAEMLRRAVQDDAVHGGEWSMAQYLYRVANGDRRYVGLPVFPLRNFTARDLYVRRGGPIREPADLAGKRIGMYSYTA